MFGNLARVIFFFVAGGLAALGHIYVYQRLVRDVTASPRLRFLARWVMILLAVSALLVRPVARAVSGSAPPWLFTPFLVWLGFALYLLLTIAVLDGARGVYLRWRDRKGRPVSTERRAFLARSLATGSAVVGGGLGVFGTWRAFQAPE